VGRTQPGAQAQRRSGRIVGLDVARALALFGMMATHLLPDTVDGETVTWWQQLCGGRAAALFALLAGVSLALVTPRPASTGTPTTPEDPGTPEEPGTPERRTALRAARAGVVVRAAVIGLLGLLLGGLDTGIAVILTYYAVLFLLGLPFLGWGWRRLALFAAGWAVLAPVLSHLVRTGLPERVGANPSLGFLTAQPLRLLGELLFTGYYPAVPWLTYLLAGLAIGRLPLHRVRVAAALAAIGAATALAAWGTAWLVLHRLGGLARLRADAPDAVPFDTMSVDQALVRGTFGTTPSTSWWWLTVAAPHSSTPLDLLHTTGSAMLVIGLCLLAARAAPRALGALFAAGTMTLSLYSLHLVALALDLGPTDGTAALFWWHVAVAALLAMLWRATVGRGPLEAFTGSVSGLARATVLLLGRQPGAHAGTQAQGRST
jgi:uncharacterized membrane protein